ncbi:54S ribosomal protein L20, mitochondrial [Cytospora mali]|uniref:54S ribosomal protein L20, mitochondrial n=1 Tax=Cytospora mali TaxID=578113 RepID=A0A194W819_CYTMA|nr:54S ribosomal protein L20, mitochondrial [Valsa mali]
MEAAAQTLFRPVAAARGSLKSCTQQTLKQQQIRTQATSARSRRTLNIPPHPSFLASDARSQQDHIILNPPAAAPSVYHTPFKFLPKTDPRRRANLTHLFESHFAASDVKVEDIPTVRPTDGKASSIASRGPWSVTALADKFDLPRGFVMACCQAPKEKIEFERRKLELIQQRWGPIRAKARQQKERRREMLLFAMDDWSLLDNWTTGTWLSASGDVGR